MTEAITFNVGGAIFTTTRETLLKEANSKLALIARGSLYCVRDAATGAYLLDRDGKHFPLILNFLRDSWCLLPASSEERRELLQEVRYYGLTGFEGWLRTQELLADSMGLSAQEHVAMESPRPRPHYQLNTLSFGSPSSAPPATASTTPIRSAPHGAPYGSTSWAPTAAHATTFASTLGTFGRSSPSPGAPPPGLRSPYAGATASAPPQTSAAHSMHGGSGYPASGIGGGASPGRTVGGGGGGGMGGGAGDTIAALREAFLTATGVQRPAPHVAAYSLAPTVADDSSGWTNKYLRGNEHLRHVVNTLLELAFMPPLRALHGGKTHVSISVACGHGREASLVGSKQEQLRGQAMEVRARGSLGWTFELVVRPGSDAVVWDKYEGVAAAVQDNWFVLGAILRDQFGVVLEEDSTARPACLACRRTNLAVTLNKIY